ncbi:uracil-xanthine permease family protein [Hespellia stercorisuis]|uniref:Nucleobase:cation symporter-2, NCS2 family n=1 Tax=Hespellia stercorisuis DSM 15480 TaxID=1121950 RepID=A0A1M6VIJ1_9FIRM|nr:nucleobase:cation symporter-2 family protein [Hespellia stercorisuis]SHK81333.1 nucleobase:cation symporter-2, NCS2 family [Hespellia stercorisuis DSM 15480]
MSTETKKLDNALFDLNGKPSYKQAFPLALQHVVAMIVGCVTPAIIIGGMAMDSGEITAADMTILVQSALLIAGIATLMQLASWKHRIGSGLPVIMGVSFAYLASLQGITEQFDLATLFGATLVGGVVAVLVGIFIKRLLFLFPPLVTGTVVFVIGVTLYPTAVKYMAGGAGSENYGSWQNWVVALITLAVVTVLNHCTKGITKLASILIGMVVGYIVAIFFGLVDFSAVAQANWIQFTEPVHFGLKFEASSIITMAILYTINSVQAIGDFTATTDGGMDRVPTEQELSGGIIGNGLASMIGAVIGGLPTATFSQNVGIVTTTKVVAKRVFYMASGMIIIAGLIPKFASALTTIPSCVLGGATISVFASITMTGIKLIAKSELTARNTAIVGLGVALGVGVTLVPETLAAFPQWVTLIFGKSAVVLATIITVVLNQILPKDVEETAV